MGWTYDFQEIRGSAGTAIIEDANYQPTGFPRKPIEICLAVRGHGGSSGCVMTVNNVTVSVPLIEVMGVSFPQQGQLILTIERDVRINRGMNKHAVRIDMNERQVCYPIKVGLRNSAQGRSI